VPTAGRQQSRVQVQTQRLCSCPVEGLLGFATRAGRPAPWHTIHESRVAGQGSGVTNHQSKVTNHAALSSPVQPARQNDPAGCRGPARRASRRRACRRCRRDNCRRFFVGGRMAGAKGGVLLLFFDGIFGVARVVCGAGRDQAFADFGCRNFWRVGGYSAVFGSEAGRGDEAPPVSCAALRCVIRARQIVQERRQSGDWRSQYWRDRCRPAGLRIGVREQSRWEAGATKVKGAQLKLAATKSKSRTTLGALKVLQRARPCCGGLGWP
jgi:hypothetical protein